MQHSFLLCSDVALFTHVYDDPLAVVVVVLDRVEVVLARVLRVLVDALILVRAQLRERPGKRERITFKNLAFSSARDRFAKYVC